jgi:transposase
MYRQTPNPRTRIRVQMILLASAGKDVSEIAAITRVSDDTVRYWLHRFLLYGYAGLIEGDHPGRPAQVTTDIECFLLDCLERSPREFGVPRPTWTTATLAQVVARRFRVEVTDECIRQHLERRDIVCRRPTWSVKHLAQQQSGYAQKKGRLPVC